MDWRGASLSSAWQTSPKSLSWCWEGKMNEVIVGIIGLGVLLALFLTGIELAFAMIIVGFFGFAYVISFEAAFNMMAKDVFDTFESYNLTVVPLFVLMGQIAF